MSKPWESIALRTAGPELGLTILRLALETGSGRSGVTVLYTQATLDEVRLAVTKVWQEPMAGM